MASYLERYQQGEQVQVWRELVALGAAVRQEPIHSDALAVARETMRRARHNVELLVERLKQLGFDFQYPNELLTPLAKDELAALDEFEREVGPLPLSVRAWAEVVGTVNFMGTYPKLSYYDATVNPFFGKALAFGRVEVDDLRQFVHKQLDVDLKEGLADDMMQNVNDQLNSMIASMGKAFGQFFGTDAMESTQQDYQKKLENPKPEIPEADRVESDPLVVDLRGLDVEDYEAWQDEIEAGELDEPYMLEIAPDIFHKSNISGGGPYGIVIPNAAADALLLENPWGDLTFVEYLRLSFAWAGFPGLQDFDNRDDALINQLKAGLLPL